MSMGKEHCFLCSFLPYLHILWLFLSQGAPCLKWRYWEVRSQSLLANSPNPTHLPEQENLIRTNVHSLSFFLIDVPIDGRWSCWSDWSACSGGHKTRQRQCNNPLPQKGGSPCSGPASETLDCQRREQTQLVTWHKLWTSHTLPGLPHISSHPGLPQQKTMPPCPSKILVCAMHVNLNKQWVEQNPNSVQGKASL